MTLADWFTHIRKLHPRCIDLSLTRLRAVTDRLNLTVTCPVVTVAGTNGKGSVVHVLHELYRCAGHRVASYTSPHLWQFNERLRLGDPYCSNDALTQAFSKIEAHRGETTLTFFEYTTLACLLIAREWQPDILLVDVGRTAHLNTSHSSKSWLGEHLRSD